MGAALFYSDWAMVSVLANQQPRELNSPNQRSDLITPIIGSHRLSARDTMDDDGDLVNVMLVIAVAALILVVGELYIVNRPGELPAILVLQYQLDRAP
jgi:hypothetical protein